MRTIDLVAISILALATLQMAASITHFLVWGGG